MEAKNGGEERIPVTFFPARLNDESYAALAKKYSAAPGHIVLWTELNSIYHSFENSHKLPDIGISKNGSYYIKS